MSINGLEITDIKVFPLKNKKEGSNLEAFAKIVLNDAFVVSGIRIVNGSNGLFLGFPQDYKQEEKKGYDICFPTTAELRTYITEAVISAFNSGSN